MEVKLIPNNWAGTIKDLGVKEERCTKKEINKRKLYFIIIDVEFLFFALLTINIIIQNQFNGALMKKAYDYSAGDVFDVGQVSDDKQTEINSKDGEYGEYDGENGNVFKTVIDPNHSFKENNWNMI
ncbi:23786_t:CDS:2 [Entrophospora sp. SA101]|nr:23786_t:CDS:2 [Entrophospora sp. SA101]